MMIQKGLSVNKTIEITAPIEDVWDAITNPDKIKQYFFGTEAVTSWEEGDSIIFQGEFDGKSYRDKGNILSVNKPEFLQYDYWSGFSGLKDISENYSTVTYRLEEKDGSTFIHLSQIGFANEEARDHAIGGWDAVLGNMKDLVEGKE